MAPPQFDPLGVGRPSGNLERLTVTHFSRVALDSDALIMVKHRDVGAVH
jgi:hypothetical protein